MSLGAKSKFYFAIEPMTIKLNLSAYAPTSQSFWLPVVESILSVTVEKVVLSTNVVSKEFCSYVLQISATLVSVILLKLD